jgi:hypothetical protein
MKRFLPVFMLALAWNIANPLHAQETPENELELVRRLTAKGWTELARIRIETLLARKDPVLNLALPLELANVNIIEAKQKDPEQRLNMFTTARGHLQDFIQKNQGKGEAARASAQLARLTSYHAQVLLSKALRDEDAKSRHEKARPAEKMFIQAAGDLNNAVKALEAAQQAASNTELKAALTRDLAQTKFDIAVNLFDQARTYIDRSKFDVNAARSKAMTAAKDAFAKMRTNDGSEVDWLANAWLMKIAMETDTPGDVNKYYEYIMKYRDDKASQPAIQPALRLIGYFALQDYTLGRPDESETIGSMAIANKKKEKLSPVQRLHKVQADGEAWLKAYPAHHKTYEGQGVLFEVAMAHFIEAREDKKAAPTHLKNALDKFDELASLDGDLAERARQISFFIKLDQVKSSKTELVTFDEFYLKAMLERRDVMALSQQLDDPKLSDKEKLEAKRKEHLRGVITALNKALALSTSSTPVAKVDDAFYYLCGAYLAVGDFDRGAVVAEALGRAKVTRRAAEGAATAIQTYAAISGRNPKDEATRNRLLDMAEFVLANEKIWGSEPAMSLAHYHLGMMDRETNPKKAIAHLAKLPPEFNDYIYTQGQVVFIAEAAREKTEDPKEKAFYVSAAKAAINRMPKFNASADSSSVITMYFFAKLEMARYLHMEAMEELNAKEELKAVKKCNEMTAFVRGLQGDLERLPGKTISAKNRDQIDFSIQVWLKYANLGLAEIKFRSTANDRYDQVLEATKTVVNDALAVAKKTPTGEKIPMKDFRVTADILNLALRASVQKGDVDKGKAILDVLQRLTGVNKEENIGNIVAVLLNDITGQIRRMTDAKDPNLPKTKQHYTAFLDVIAKEYETKGLDNNATLLLAHAFNSLDYPAKAAAMFGKFKAPAALDKPLVKKAKETDEDVKARQKIEEEINRYWAIRIDYIRALRACKDKDSLETAFKTAEAMVKHENARFTFQAKMERNLTAEDQEKYRVAFGYWQLFMKEPALKNNLGNPEVQKLYFGSYVHWCRSLYLTATKDPDIKDRPKLIASAAKMIVDLEFNKEKDGSPKPGWQVAGPRFQEMLKDRDYESLKKEYEKQKSAREKGASLRPGSGDALVGAWSVDPPMHPICTEPRQRR